jgi:hypothetical protein
MKKKVSLVYLRNSWFKLNQNPDPHWIRIRIGHSSKMLDPDPYPHITNADPKHCNV